jgi:hypothetical protein
MNPGQEINGGKVTHLFTMKNIGSFFTAPVQGLTTAQALLVKSFAENAKHSATIALENAPYELAYPIVSDIIGTYNKSVGLVTYGWAGGNA